MFRLCWEDMPRHSYWGKGQWQFILQTQGRIEGCGSQQGLRRVNLLLDSKIFRARDPDGDANGFNCSPVWGQPDPQNQNQMSMSEEGAWGLGLGNIPGVLFLICLVIVTMHITLVPRGSIWIYVFTQWLDHLFVLMTLYICWGHSSNNKKSQWAPFNYLEWTITLPKCFSLEHSFKRDLESHPAMEW